MGFKVISDILYVDLIIVFMGSDKTRINKPVGIIDIDDQPVFISGNVKNYRVTDKGCGAVMGFNILRAGPVCIFGFNEPCS